jgi:hypothetical protein
VLPYPAALTDLARTPQEYILLCEVR